jgi:hypothetical protein
LLWSFRAEASKLSANTTTIAQSRLSIQWAAASEGQQFRIAKNSNLSAASSFEKAATGLNDPA